MTEELGAATTERLVVGLVRGVHGLRGAVRVEVLTDHPESRFVPGTVLVREGSESALTIASAEPIQDGPGWRIRFAEISTREGADRLRSVYLESVVLPGSELARGEVYWHEVVGVEVRDLDGASLGTVDDVYRVAQNEVYVVTGGPHGDFDLPAVRAFIRIFAPRRGEIVVDPIALGLDLTKRAERSADRPKAPRRTSRRRKPATPDHVEATPGSGDPPADG